MRMTASMVGMGVGVEPALVVGGMKITVVGGVVSIF